jgi:AbrB family looped-hinge helix DNA binding protein
VAVFTRVRFSAELDSKGRITVPAEIRNRLELGKGDRISLGLESTKILRKDFSTKSEALNYLRELENVESFSFDSGTLEVVLSD